MQSSIAFSQASTMNAIQGTNRNSTQTCPKHDTLSLLLNQSEYQPFVSIVRGSLKNIMTLEGKYNELLKQAKLSESEIKRACLSEALVCLHDVFKEAKNSITSEQMNTLLDEVWAHALASNSVLISETENFVALSEDATRVNFASATFG